MKVSCLRCVTLDRMCSDDVKFWLKSWQWCHFSGEQFLPTSEKQQKALTSSSLKLLSRFARGFFFPLVSAKPTFTWIVRLQIFRLGCKSTIHLVCVMTGPGVSCVILSSTAQSCDAPPPSWLQPWWSLLVLLLQTCWVILENYDRQCNGFCRMHFIF